MAIWFEQAIANIAREGKLTSVLSLFTETRSRTQYSAQHNNPTVTPINKRKPAENYTITDLDTDKRKPAENYRYTITDLDTGVSAKEKSSMEPNQQLADELLGNYLFFPLIIKVFRRILTNNPLN